MKRYALFVMDSYSPCGGAADFYGWYDTEEDARREVEKRVPANGANGLVWAQVTDRDLALVRVGMVRQSGRQRAHEWTWTDPKDGDQPLGWDFAMWGGT